jgi:hypothetical protein
VATDAEEAARLIGRLGRAAEKRLGDREIARKLPAFLLLQPFGDAATDILLDVSGVAAEHFGQSGKVFTALHAQLFKDMTRVCHH